MSIKLNGATSGSVALDVPAVVGGDVSLELPGGGTVDRLERAGNILQVVYASTSTAVVVSTETWTDTGLTATITPTSASSKVLVLVSQPVNFYRTATAAAVATRLYRDATVIVDPPTYASGPASQLISTGGVTSQNLIVKEDFKFLDSPNTTSAVTYKTMGRPQDNANGGTAVYQTNSDDSYIQLLEIAA